MKEDNFEELIDEIYGISPTNETIKEYENINHFNTEEMNCMLCLNADIQRRK